MRKLFLLSIFTLAAPLEMLHAAPVGADLSEYGIADSQLYHVYWRLYNRLPVAAQQRLKADEIRWINWKDTLPLDDRIQATYNRIAILEQF
jgi:uncharacterized protein YecT (DUF1311 family)